MKKLLTVLFAVLMVLTLAGCSKKEEEKEEPLVDPAPTAANTYADYDAAEVGTELEVLVSVQTHESWWDGKVTIYAQDDDGGYLIYDCAADEATAEAMTPGTLIRVKGLKGEWSGEKEITDGTVEIIAGGYDGKVYEAEDVTALVGNNDELAKHMNKKILVKNLTVVDHMYDWNNGGTRESSDLYLHCTDEKGTPITFTVRRYMFDCESELFKSVEALEAGDVVDLSAYLYWYEEPQARIYEVVKH